jgi:hypothetical protein
MSSTKISTISLQAAVHLVHRPRALMTKKRKKIKVIKVAQVLIITFNRKACSYNVFYMMKS